MPDRDASALVVRAQSLLATPRRSLREAKDRRAYRAPEYGRALDAMQTHHAAAVRAYASALGAEAAAHRAEARELRELLTDLVESITRTENNA